MDKRTIKILNLAIPSTVENILQTTVGFVDTLMVAKIGLIAITSVGVINSIINVYLAVYIAIGVGTSALISRAIGAKNPKLSQKYSKQSVIITIITSLLFMLVSIFWGRIILNQMTNDSMVIDSGLLFFKLIGGFSIFIGLMTCFSAILRANGDTKTPMKVSFIVNVLNIFLNYVFIFGFSIIPAFGITGSAIGSVTARLVGCILLYSKVQKSDSKIEWLEKHSFVSYKEIMNLTIPAAIERIVMRMGQVVYFGIIVSIGPMIFAAHSVAGTIESYTYMPAYGLATAVGTLAGMSLGSNKLSDLKFYIRKSTQIGFVVLSCLGIILFFGAPIITSIFTQDKNVSDMVITALRIDSFIQPALAISLILTGALQGMGDTKSPLYGTVIGMWVIRILGVVLLDKIFNLGIAGVWISIGIDLYLKSCFYYFMTKRRIQKTELKIETMK